MFGEIKGKEGKIHRAIETSVRAVCSSVKQEVINEGRYCRNPRNINIVRPRVIKDQEVSADYSVFLIVFSIGARRNNIIIVCIVRDK